MSILQNRKGILGNRFFCKTGLGIRGSIREYLLVTEFLHHKPKGFPKVRKAEKRY
jgi:hypothetical protein